MIFVSSHLVLEFPLKKTNSYLSMFMKYMSFNSYLKRKGNLPHISSLFDFMVVPDQNSDSICFWELIFLILKLPQCLQICFGLCLTTLEEINPSLQHSLYFVNSCRYKEATSKSQNLSRILLLEYCTPSPWQFIEFY